MADVETRTRCREIALVIDDFARPAVDTADVYELIVERHRVAATVVTSNRKPDSWGTIVDDTTVAAAMLHRLLHRSVVFNITGDSYQLRAPKPGTANSRKESDTPSHPHRSKESR